MLDMLTIQVYYCIMTYLLYAQNKILVEARAMK